MPSLSSAGPRLRVGALLASLLCVGMPSLAQERRVGSAGRELPADAQLFYQLLIGEIELRSGEAGTAYRWCSMRPARRDEQLFRRATEIALQAAPATGRSPR